MNKEQYTSESASAKGTHRFSAPLRRGTALLAALTIAVSFCGCTSKKDKTASSSSSTSSTTQTTATESTAEVSKTKESTSAQSINKLEKSIGAALDECVSFGPGTSGSSLNSASAAVGLVTWAEKNNASDFAKSTLVSAVSAWYKKQDDDHQDMFDENWETIRDDGNLLFSDFSGNKGLFEDAGVLDEAKTAAAASGGQADWTALYAAVNQAV